MIVAHKESSDLKELDDWMHKAMVLTKLEGRKDYSYLGYLMLKVKKCLEKAATAYPEDERIPGFYQKAEEFQRLADHERDKPIAYWDPTIKRMVCRGRVLPSESDLEQDVLGAEPVQTQEDLAIKVEPEEKPEVETEVADDVLDPMLYAPKKAVGDFHR